MQILALLALTAIIGGALWYVFTTKIEGFGPLTTGLPIVLATLYVAALAIIFDKLATDHIANILFAAMGYGGGLLTTTLFYAKSR
ncbi:MAG: hypothetical protein K8F92_16085 [Hyphomicrobium sp.]|uniref:hypothetical protein n=1 Tax=Hyphomicrobium sp. TaxID=82 RepID=UPI001328495C|nr:hypothetical protein [Hyphomicrobium sp.]KAB2940332.1 MAG: hypothetical protein F9K20_13890 [Hyphomicrobium sp.]MBZ0211151.1 hypothetical protein [Hyphomicrobium sp.]